MTYIPFTKVTALTPLVIKCHNLSLLLLVLYLSRFGSYNKCKNKIIMLILTLLLQVQNIFLRLETLSKVLSFTGDYNDAFGNHCTNHTSFHVTFIP